MKRTALIKVFSLLLTSLLLAGCSATRFLEEDECLLSGVSVKSDDGKVKVGEYRRYVRQEPNSRWFNFLKVPLGLYCISGNDSTKRVNKFFRKIGQAPVIYDDSLTSYTVNSLTDALRSKGYPHARVSASTTTKKRRVKVKYVLSPGKRYFVRTIERWTDDARMDSLMEQLSEGSLLQPGMPLDVALLEEERTRLIGQLQNLGYYNLQNDYITFRADTIAGSPDAALTLLLRRPVGVDSLMAYEPYTVRSVRLTEEPPPAATDTSDYNGMQFIHARRPRLYRKVYDRHVAVNPGAIYSERASRNTYVNLNNLPPVSYTTLRYAKVPGDSALLDCDIRVTLGKSNSVSAELEGTNTAGNLGAALSLSYSNRNLVRGAELLTVKLRGAYEAITGLEGYQNANYIEYGAEATLRFPSFKLPFVPKNRKYDFKAYSEFSLMYGSQDRPEFHRRVVTGSWGYRWTKSNKPRLSHRFDLVSLNYVFMPWISDTFRKDYLEGDDPHYSILRYSYEDLFIMHMAYSLVWTSLRNIGSNGLYETNGWQVRFSAETAGNLLYGASKAFGTRKNAAGQYALFDIAYSQYAKVDFDFAKSRVINDRNSVAFRFGLGIAIPYGNSTILPYEKRYFSGGANSVRGWNARALGPGSYAGKDGKIDFINQTGNLKLDLSFEYRTHLFWKFHAAFFVDAGNIWSTRNYPDQPGGQFKIDEFYKQIAVAYGLGIRLNFDYFILRFDGGMKAVNPAVESGKGHYPLIHPNLKRDFAFHFAVGLPF